MQPGTKKKNSGSYFILTLAIVAVVGIFTYFIYRFTQYDKTEYEVPTGSVIYNQEREYSKIEGEAYLTQKIDKNYYLYEKIDGETTKQKIGKNAVIYKEGDMNVYLYGTAYQVLSTGDVDIVKGETKIVKSAPTKFFKLDDRQYLIVDPSIRSVESEILDTKDYVMVNLDKKGNPSFSNHLVDFKTISQLVVSTSTFTFDIALEKLVFEDTEIDLKNVIGSTNEYVEPEEEPIDYTDDKLHAIQDNINASANTIVNYYDQYFNDVIKSVNNLTISVVGVNTNALKAVEKEEVYYDFVKWLALKSVTPKVASIEVEYSIFDPSDEYQVVHLVVDGPQPPVDGIDPDKHVHALNKNDSKYTIRDLKPDSSYTISLSYYKVGYSEETIEDTVVVTTKKAGYSIKVYKVSKETVLDDYGDPASQYTIFYEMTVEKGYKFSTAEIKFTGYKKDNKLNIYSKITETPIEFLYGKNVDSSGVYNGKITLPVGTGLSDKNVVSVDNLKFCIDAEYTNCTKSPIDFSYKFFNE